MKIYAPVKNATGVWCSVHFQNGVGETDKPHLIKWFKDHGYRVEAEKTITDVMDEVLKIADEVPEKPLEEMTPLELRELAKANGHGGEIKNIRNKERLIEIIRG